MPKCEVEHAYDSRSGSTQELGSEARVMSFPHVISVKECMTRCHKIITFHMYASIGPTCQNDFLHKHLALCGCILVE